MAPGSRGSPSCAGASVRITPRELGLLFCLADGGDRTVDRRAILNEVWGRGVAVGPNVIDVYVGYVRDKLAQVAADGVAIETERATGYRPVVAPSPVPTGRA